MVTGKTKSPFTFLPLVKGKTKKYSYDRGGNYQNSRGFHNQRGYRGNNRGRLVELIICVFLQFALQRRR